MKLANNLNEFIDRRRDERDFLFASGYNNDDTKTNGEFALLRKLIPYCSHFFDIGYNKGTHSIFVESISSECGIFGFEPNLAHIAQSDSHVIFRVGLSDTVSQVSLNVHPTESGVSSIFPRMDMNPSFRSEFEQASIELCTFDNIYRAEFSSRINEESLLFLKIDVEGAEPKVLRGASHFLKKDNVLGYFEYSTAWSLSGYSLRSVFYYLDELGYCLYRITPLGLEHMRFFHPVMENYRYQNIFFAREDILDSYFKSIEVAWEFSETKYYLFE